MRVTTKLQLPLSSAAAMATALSFTSASFLHPLKLKTPSTPHFSSTPFFTPLCRASQPDRPNPKHKPKPKPMEGQGQRPADKNRRRSRRSILKKSLRQEQVTFTAAVPDDPVVAIIGGGLAGLVCAQNLDKRGIRSTVFDTGMHGLGGRMGTRLIEPDGLIFDHAAQFFTVSDPQFAELVNSWLDKGLVQEWKGLIGNLENGGRFTPLPSAPPRYYGVNGMRPLADSLALSFSAANVVRPCWISKLEPFNGKWYVSENGKPQGEFDAIVIAHNGKCANRLLSTSGLPLIAGQMKRLELSSIWALLAAFEDPLPIPDTALFEGAFVKGVDSLSWMGNNSRKLLNRDNNGPHCWTFFSTASFGKQNKVPQENIPNASAERVKAGMLSGVESALGLSEGSLQTPFYTKVQLWGAALPMNSPRVPCIFDPHGRAGICGDWLLGSSMESAALSGITLANHMADYFQNRGAEPDEFAIGLQNEFEALSGHDIGQFPGMESENLEKVRDFELVSS